VLQRLRAEYGEPERPGPIEPIDELVMTILSQHTSDQNTERAFASLRAAFPRWEDVIDAADAKVANAIRSGGLANIKAPRIRKALADVRERIGGFDLSFLADLPVDDARDWLTSLDGVGPKTASCVLLFSLDRPVMPVDTHVHRVTLRLGLIPAKTSAERAHQLLEALVPDGEHYAAHLLLIRHGRATCHARRPRCPSCVLVQCCPAASTFLSDEQEQHDG
jgi:endonuclease-3